MKREDLFLAIGMVEEERLAKTEMTVVKPSGDDMEGTVLKKLSVGRIIRNILVAAVIVSLLTTTAFAAVGYILYDSPKELLTSLFGDNTGYDHNKGGEIYNENGGLEAVEPTYDKVPVDESVVAENVEPYVSPVGRSISWKGYTLTVDALMHDPASKCGVLAYTLENPDGIPEYKVGYDGEIIFQDRGHPVEINHYGDHHIIQEKTTSTRLAVAYYYRMNAERSPDFELTLSQWSWRTMEMAVEDQRKMEEMTKAEFDEWLANFPECPDKITIPVSREKGLKNVSAADGRIDISPICIHVDVTDMDFLERDGMLKADCIGTLTIRYADGTEYPVWGENLANTIFAVEDDMEGMGGTYMFNRIIDIDKVSAVVINGTEFPVT